MRKTALALLTAALCVPAGFALSLQTPESETVAPSGGDQPDEAYLWLEDIEGDAPLNWASSQSDQTVSTLSADPRFEAMVERFSQSGQSDPLSGGFYPHDGRIYRMFTPSSGGLGRLESMSQDAFLSGGEDWTVAFDFAERLDTEDYVPHPFSNFMGSGLNCAPTEPGRCLIRFSYQGSDAGIVREIDLETGDFVPGGFETTDIARVYAYWIDIDTLAVVGGQEAPEDVSGAGWPVTVDVWSRGADRNAAREVFPRDPDTILLYTDVVDMPEGRAIWVGNAHSFDDIRYNLVSAAGEVEAVATPPLTSFPYPAHVAGHMVGLVDRDVEFAGESIGAGEVIALDLTNGGTLSRVFDPGAQGTVSGISSGAHCVYMEALHNVQGQLIKACPETDGAWSLIEYQLPQFSSVEVRGVAGDTALVEYQSYLTPPTSALVGEVGLQAADRPAETVMDADGFAVQQFWATADDGVEIPYYLVGPETLEGPYPVMMHAYGGFGITMTPAYFNLGDNSLMAAPWLEAGGIYVVPAIRGGGAFGPDWHDQAVAPNNQRSFDDMYAVINDLIARGYTRAGDVGFYGASNGGLLAATLLTQRPDLFGGIISGVPLTDMMRFDQMLSGRTWVTEYGRPEVESERAALLAYSPFHNIDASADYPPALVYTSTRDDRVHPAHARKFAARLEDAGQPVLYYENQTGGHGGASDLRSKARLVAMQGVFLMQSIMDEDR
ncbi:prolyl oligopeptidase family serine peptidase [Oceanicaulis sp. LC35]|uniref:prolyl oligopeptidase family serine peptidase n=1 Tax=Oceanicaulis sp. LC35 TaxID=3349635 RepID=UPI003F84EDC7